MEKIMTKKRRQAQGMTVTMCVLLFQFLEYEPIAYPQDVEIIMEPINRSLDFRFVSSPLCVQLNLSQRSQGPKPSSNSPSRFFGTASKSSNGATRSVSFSVF